MSTEQKWGWMEPDAETAHGPFDSREEAIADAQEELDDRHVEPVTEQVPIIVGRCRFADPVEAVTGALDLGHILERMDEYAGDNDFSFYDDEIFDAKDGAEKALEAALRRWAREYVSSTVWVLDDEERVLIESPKEKEGEP